MKDTISEFLSYLRIPIAKEYCERLLSSHPDYPSLLSIADVFDRLGIDYVVGKMDKTKMDQLSFPYLLQVGTDKLLAIKNDEDLIRHDKELLEWQGIVLHIEPTSQIADIDNNNHYYKEKFNRAMQVTALATISLLAILPFANRFSLQQVFLFFTSWVGVALGFLLISKELGVKFKAVETFCTSGKKSNCDQILNSSEATIAGNVKLSDAVFVYFIFQILTFSLAAAAPQLTKLFQASLSLLSVMAIPVVFFSLYVQYFKMGIWCRLCLLVNIILVIQVFSFNITFSFSELTSSLASPGLLFIHFLLFVLVGSVWMIVKNRTEAINELDKLNSANARVKNDTSVFTHLLSNQRKANDSPLKNELRLGKKEAPIRITMVSNLYCRPCKEQHTKITALLQQFPDLVTVAVRFVPSKDVGEVLNSNQYLLRYWWKKIHNEEKETELLLQFFHDWYENMDLNKFRNQYPVLVSDKSEETEALEKDHYAWVQDELIHQTPTFIVNGHHLPKGYEISDIASLMIALGNEWKSIRSTTFQNDFIPVSQ